jgi:CheY-like chemotaxis protein
VSKSESGSILVVEDEPNTRYVVTSLLEAEGYRVGSAADGAQAVETANRLHPSLVILDWMLPDRNGEQIAASLRVDHPDIRFVVVTADGRAEEKAERVNAHGHLHKPFQLDDLLALVTAALNGR